MVGHLNLDNLISKDPSLAHNFLFAQCNRSVCVTFSDKHSLSFGEPFFYSAKVLVIMHKAYFHSNAVYLHYKHGYQGHIIQYGHNTSIACAACARLFAGIRNMPSCHPAPSHIASLPQSEGWRKGKLAPPAAVPVSMLLRAACVLVAEHEAGAALGQSPGRSISRTFNTYCSVSSNLPRDCGGATAVWLVIIELL